MSQLFQNTFFKEGLLALLNQVEAVLDNKKPSCYDSGNMHLSYAASIFCGRFKWITSAQPAEPRSSRFWVLLDA